jgi:Tol biopolymer transport system component
MFNRTILLFLFLLVIVRVTACSQQEETKTAVPSLTPTKSITALPIETKTNIPQPTPNADPTVMLPTVNSQQMPTQLPQPATVNPPTPTSVYNSDTIFSTSLSMLEQCVATDNTYYLRYRENNDVSKFFQSPDNNYRLEYKDDAIWLGPLDGSLIQLPISMTNTSLSSGNIRWSPDSQYVALLNRFGEYPLWLASTDGRELTLLSPEDYNVNFVAWSPDSQYLAWVNYEASLNSNYQIVIQLPEANIPPLFIANDPSIRRLTGIGWSFDGLYFAWMVEKEDRTEELRIWSAREKRQIYQTEVSQLRYASWSPQDQWLQGRHINDLAYEHILLSADGSNFFRVPTADHIFSPPIWSPDGQALATLDVELYNRVNIIVVNTDGHVFEDNLIDKYALGRETSKIWSMTRWLQGGRSFLYVKYQVEDDTYLPMIYDHETGTARPLLSTGIVLEPPAFTTDYSQVFLVHQIGSDAWIKAVAIDRSSERILVDDALSVEKLTLFDDDRRLAYAVWRKQGWQIELVDTETGQRQLLQNNLKQVLSMTFNEESDTIIIWWLGQDDSTGVSSYFSDGRLFYQLEIEVSYRIVADFWSPNGETAVIKIDGGGVVLAYSNDRESVIVRSNLAGLGDPYWSPDSQLFAFTQLAVPRISKGIDLEIVDTAGNTLWSYSPFPLEYPSITYGRNTLKWVVCP